MQLRALRIGFFIVVASSPILGCGPSSPGGTGEHDLGMGGDVDLAGGDAVDQGGVVGADLAPGGQADLAGTPDGGTPLPPQMNDFFSGLEATEPQPTWITTVETDANGHKKASGVTGPTGGIPGNVTDQVVAVTASGENPPGEIATNVIDGDTTTKWLVFNSTGWIQFKMAQPSVVARYAISSANDAPERDPKDWSLQASQDGQTWVVIDTRSGQSFSARYQTLRYDITNATAYLYYRLQISANAGGAGLIQMSEMQLSNGDNTPPSATDMKSILGRGPGGSYNAKLSAGFHGIRAFRYAGSVPASGRGYSYNKIFDVNIPVTAATELSYLIFPDDEPKDPNYPSTYAAVDLAFSDGTYLSDLNAVDQSFATVSPAGQGASRTLYPNEWNYKLSKIGDVAAGKTIRRILIGYDYANGPAASFGGWIDDVQISSKPLEPSTPAHLSDWVLTTRGTNSGSGYSRGNNFPATAVPHGFNFWTPVTDASSNSWLYIYHRMNNNDNLPLLQALSMSHEPSPWMGDRQSFQVMPSAATGMPSADRGTRALAFRHENEIARPYYYSVKFENGIKAEIAPTDHAALMRFTFTGDDANLIFDNVDNNGGLTFDAAHGAISGYCDSHSGLSAGATRIFIYATFDKPVAASGMLSGGGGANVTGYYRFSVSAADRTVTMRIASSLISVAQAQKNLALEVAASDTLDTIKAAAQALWDQKLGVITVESGGNYDQLTTLYSNLYRLFLYPNSAFENTGTANAPVYQYASPFAAAAGANTPTQTGAQVITGKIYVNNGFWDTYRANWPAYSLLTPTDAGAMIDGFVQQYKDGGWVSRWSSPGYANLMTGSSSDVAFADAAQKGVKFDTASAYDAALRNATVTPPDGSVGRQGMDTSIFLGYTTTATGSGLSWAMAGYLNDFGIANLAHSLNKEDEYGYFWNRAQNYVNAFNPAVQFFQGKDASGNWSTTTASYDPRVWGNDYTETDGWNTAFDVAYDGQGLANLYGGTDKLAAKLDTFFSTPETASFTGSYGGVIHEMLEARDVRMGQLGLSNEPSFHIIYMYDYAGQPAKAQAKVRDALARLWVGSNIGQGYLGDEDNGAMSAWEIFGALGFYPLRVGSPNYAIGSPLFTKATVHLENGKTIVINAPNNSAKNVYIQGLKLNGAAYNSTSLNHSDLLAGAVLDFDMGPSPSAWATGAGAAPPSITTGTAVANPVHDVGGTGTATSSSAADVTALSDNTSSTQVTFTSAAPTIQYKFGTPQKVSFYTLTSGKNATDAYPTDWILNGSNDGSTWTQLDKRSGQAFKWQQQTRPFRIPAASVAAYTYYQLVVSQSSGGGMTTLAEMELLATP
jgi:predicted alpha-1,2-mannosidase